MDSIRDERRRVEKLIQRRLAAMESAYVYRIITSQERLTLLRSLSGLLVEVTKGMTAAEADKLTLEERDELYGDPV